MKGYRATERGTRRGGECGGGGGGVDADDGVAKAEQQLPELS